MEPLKRLPKSSLDRLRAACDDMLLWDHIDPDCWREYEPVPDEDYWEVQPLVPWSLGYRKGPQQTPRA